jgi:hypothetical protein
MNMIHVCVFAKSPVPGEVKTRLAASVGCAPAAALAGAFLADTWTLVSGRRWADPVIASTGMIPAGIAPGATVWMQGEGTLDERIERVMTYALSRRRGAIALGADSPGLPVEVLDEAAARVARGEAVIGPADDGGFYLLGLPRFPPGLLTGVPWSSELTCGAVLRRLSDHGMNTAMLPRWFDVDRGEDLPRLKSLLASSPDRAPRTAAALAAMAAAAPMSPA